LPPVFPLVVVCGAISVRHHWRSHYGAVFSGSL